VARSHLRHAAFQPSTRALKQRRAVEGWRGSWATTRLAALSLGKAMTCSPACPRGSSMTGEDHFPDIPTSWSSSSPPPSQAWREGGASVPSFSCSGCVRCDGRTFRVVACEKGEGAAIPYGAGASTCHSPCCPILLAEKIEAPSPRLNGPSSRRRYRYGRRSGEVGSALFGPRGSIVS